MSDRYLWDKTGAPDPEVERLERLLGGLAHRGKELPLDEAQSAPLPLPAGARRERRSLSPRWALAVAASLSIVAAAWWMTSHRGWEVARLTGQPRLGERRLTGTTRTAGGAWLVTDGGSSARIVVGRIGVVEVGPNSRLRVVGRKGNQHRLALERGVLDAFVLAPPRRFVVETPSAEAVDLGCAYTLEVDPAGGARLTVVAGWVSFEHQGLESFIPAGARCFTRPGHGPGVPYFTDAQSGVKNGLVALELDPSPSPERHRALGAVLTGARREDAFSLWHLLPRLQGEERARVFDRLAELAPPPAGVSRAGVLAGDRSMLDLWWDALGFGSVRDWRRWKAPAPTASR